MKIIIVGCGKVGDLLTSYISKEGHDVVVVDTDSQIIEDIVNEYDVMGIAGNGASNSVQLEAGANNADLLIAVTAQDELNIMCCMVARKLGTRHTIARVRNPDYSEQIVFMRKEFGISMAVNPEFDAAHEISRIIQFPAAIKVDTFAKGRVDLVEIKIGKGHPLCGRRLSELSSVYGVSILVCAVRRGDEVTIPSGDFITEADDILHITAPHSELAAFFKKLGIAEKRIRSVMIIGGGKIAFFLSKMLISLGIKVKIVEADPERANTLSELLPKAMVIQGDGTDSDILIEEGVDQVDACVSLTGIDEENIIISMFAGTRKVDKVITKINHLNMMKMLSSIGLECIVSPKNISANNILRYLRGIENSDGSSIQTLYKIVDGKAEALEFIAAESFGYLSMPIKDIKLKKNLLLACIIRQSKIIYPHGSDTIELGDSVIVVAKSDDALRGLEDIIA
ncbi:MAG: Trk system potassium transporter TrkA [Clostridiales bacterium]|nr:Trk system potassium transporter TrkA [Clostridiales bacterium]